MSKLLTKSLFLIPFFAAISANLLAYPLELHQYTDQNLVGVLAKLQSRINFDIFNLVVTIIFGCAIVHTFLSGYIHNIAIKIQRGEVARIKALKASGKLSEDHSEHSFLGVFLLFIGEVEIVLFLWVFILGLFFVFFKDWATFTTYLDSVSYSEPLFVVVIMTIASTKPITYSAEKVVIFLSKILKFVFRNKTAAFWFVTLAVLPMLGSVITEVAAITICSLLLCDEVIKHSDDELFKYGTFAILLVNISIGGALTNYAAPVIFVVVDNWSITTPYIFFTFGWHILVSIFITTTLGFLLFRKELKSIDRLKSSVQEVVSNHNRIPIWVILVHYLFIYWSVINLHNAVLFVGGYILFFGFMAVTRPFQRPADIRGPMLVGLFIAGLLIHGGLQGWWIAPMVSSFSDHSLFWTSAILSSFNDNASITYISSLTPDVQESTKFAIIAGAISAGGLTIIANAPNLTAFTTMRKYFKGGAISHIKVFLAALIPTAITIIFMYYFNVYSQERVG